MPVDRFGLTGGSGAYDINNNSQAVGYASFPFYSAAILWRDDKAIDIGTLPLEAGFTPAASALAINDADVIVGKSLTSVPGGPGARASHAFRWADGVFTDLGTLRGPLWNSVAQAIDSRGNIVGQSDCFTVACAFLWTEAEAMLDLNALIDPAAGWRLSTATGINDDGWIVGRGFLDNEARDFLLLPETVPIPEPASLAMMALGLLMLVARRAHLRQPAGR